MEPILYIGISQSSFAGIVLLSNRRKNLPNLLLGLWLLLIAFDMLLSLIAFYNENFFIFITAPFAYSPLLYFYVFSLVKNDFEISSKHLIQFVPFIVFFALSLNLHSTPIADTKSFLDVDTYFFFRFFYGVSIFLSVTIYTALSYIKIKAYQSQLENYSAFKSAEISLNWTKFVVLVYFITFNAMFLIGGVQVFGRVDPFTPTIIAYLGLTIFAFLISYFGIKQPNLFGYVLDENEKSDVKYERSGLTEVDSEKFIKKLENFMRLEKPFLNPDLTIQMLASELNISRHHLTQILNEKLNKNFYSYINEFRVEEVKEQLKNPEYENYTLLALALKAGFKSKSTFNDFFKKYVGMTPSQYKSSLEN